ncbi:MAG: hypothetical protein QOF61_483 [Acidobacteriota bacterium]|nr:hypothetical protein [Acidobacteriota bacterium]
MKTTSLAPFARLAALLFVAAAVCAQAQQKIPDKATTQDQKTNAIAANAPAAAKTPVDLARATYASLGGDKYRDLKNMVLLGSADLYAPNSAQSLAGKFGMITSGEKIRIEMNTFLSNFSLVFDGVRTSSSVPGFQMPPPNKFGMPVLMKFDREGYEVTALPDKKKERGFRITDAEGDATDFYVDAATGRLLRYEVPYGAYTYSFEFKSVRELEGVVVPVSFVMRLTSTQGSFFAEFKVKDAKLNQELPEDTFLIRNK